MSKISGFESGVLAGRRSKVQAALDLREVLTVQHRLASPRAGVIIGRFGRFPHRNKALGREMLPEEEEAVKEGAAW